MKLVVATFLDIDDLMAAGETQRVLTLFGRVNRILALMTQQLWLLETMLPKDYQEIRLRLGNGSGQKSPVFRILLHMPQQLWPNFETHYLRGRSVREVYDTGYSDDDAYAVAEAMMEFDESFQKFRWHHLFLIHRSIGMGSASLKGRSVDLLQAGAKHRFYPPLWDVRGEMTDAWGRPMGKCGTACPGSGLPVPSRNDSHLRGSGALWRRSQNSRHPHAEQPAQQACRSIGRN